MSSSFEPKQIDLAEVHPEVLYALKLLFDAILRRLAREAGDGKAKENEDECVGES